VTKATSSGGDTVGAGSGAAPTTLRAPWSADQHFHEIPPASSALTKLATINGTGSSNVIKFLNSSTPWTSYRDLLIQGSMRSLTTGQDEITVNFNGSFGGICTILETDGTGVSHFQNTTFQLAGHGWIPTTSFDSHMQASISLWVFDVNSALWKNAHALYGGAGTASGFMLVGDAWANDQSTAPITEIDLTMAGNYSTDSQLTLYGFTG